MPHRVTSGFYREESQGHHVRRQASPAPRNSVFLVADSQIPNHTLRAQIPNHTLRAQIPNHTLRAQIPNHTLRVGHGQTGQLFFF